MKLSQIDRIPAASRASPQKHVLITLVGIPYLSLIYHMYNCVASGAGCVTSVEPCCFWQTVLLLSNYAASGKQCYFCRTMLLLANSVTSVELCCFWQTVLLLSNYAASGKQCYFCRTVWLLMTCVVTYESKDPILLHLNNYYSFDTLYISLFIYVPSVAQVVFPLNDSISQYIPFCTTDGFRNCYS